MVSAFPPRKYLVHISSSVQTAEMAIQGGLLGSKANVKCVKCINVYKNYGLRTFVVNFENVDFTRFGEHYRTLNFNWEQNGTFLSSGIY